MKQSRGSYCSESDPEHSGGSEFAVGRRDSFALGNLSRAHQRKKEVVEAVTTPKKKKSFRCLIVDAIESVWYGMVQIRADVLAELRRILELVGRG